MATKSKKIFKFQITKWSFANIEISELTKYVIPCILSIHVGAWKEKKWLKKRSQLPFDTITMTINDEIMAWTIATISI